MKKLAAVVFSTALYVTSIAQPIQFGGIEESRPLKRGKEYIVRWSGGAADARIQIELTRSGEVIQRWEKTHNGGEQKIRLKTRIRPGSGYQIIIASDDGRTLLQREVTIARRIPLLVQLTAIAVPTAIIVFLSRPVAGEATIESPVPPSH